MEGKLGRDDAQGMFHVLSQQRTVYDISHVRDVSEGQTLDVARVDVFHILTVALAEDDFFDAGALGRKGSL